MSVTKVKLIARIGTNGELTDPWKDPEHVKTVRYHTHGGVMVIGYKTSRNLPVMAGRTVCVMERGETPYEIISRYHGRTLWICGGRKTYDVWMPFVDQFIITKDKNPPVDHGLFMPPLWLRKRNRK